jgi:murein DD-endopeptidase MepM/ murein hydrolase activator NlpD
MRDVSQLKVRIAASSALIVVLLVSSIYIGRSSSDDERQAALVANRLAANDYEYSLQPLDTALDSTLPAARSASGDAQTRLTLAVADGETLAGLLNSADVSTAETQAALEALRHAYDPRKLRAGQFITVNFKSGGRFQGFQMQADNEHLVTVSRDQSGFVAVQTTIPVKTETRAARGVIRNSLFESAANAGVPYPVTAAMIRAFSYDVDFQRDIQPGDRFRVMYDTLIGDSGSRAGDVLFAELVLSGKPHAIYGVRREDGAVEFYTRDGKSVRKGLLRTPVDGARLTSGFGMRLHPLLGFTRMHKGVDFGVPTGTPIFAAGDAVVEQSGWAGGYGRFVKLRHNQHTETAYGHMSRIALTATVGQRVHQGQIIGYVGMTGDATGPHLHYEVIKDGTQVNPITLTSLPADNGLEGSQLVAFLKKAKDSEDRFAALIDGKQFAQAGQSK